MLGKLNFVNARAFAKNLLPELLTGKSLAVAGTLLAIVAVIGFSTRSYAEVLAFDAVADAQLSTATPARVNGTDVKMAVCGNGTPLCTPDNVNEKRAVIKFNVTAITSPVVSAKLRFYVTSKPVPAMQVKQMTTTTWEENSATWNNTANQPTTSATYTNAAGPAIGWYDVDVTGAVTTNGTVSFIVSNPTSTTTRIATRETTTKPQLVVTTQTQTAPPTDACPSIPGDQPAGTNCTPTEPPVSAPMKVYYGTTHTHTGGSNTHGTDTSTAADVFATAKASGFNFIILTEHSGPTGPADGSAFYADAKAKADLYTEPDKFVGIAGYEYSENGGDDDTDNGHITAWGTDQYVNASAPGMKFTTFFSILANDRLTRPVIAGFSHPDAPGHNASIPSLLTPESRDTIAMSELSNKVAFIAADEAGYYQAFVNELDRGWRVAPSCGLDSHGLGGLTQPETSTKKPCRTGLLAPTLTKDSLVDAFKQRRIYSSRDINMQVLSKVNGFWMGSQVGTPPTANFDINVTDPDITDPADKITKIEIIGSGGAVLASQAFDAHSVSWQPSVPVGTNKYMFALVYNGERVTHTAVGAPVWFE